jgi:hypothetical protein
VSGPMSRPMSKPMSRPMSRVMGNLRSSLAAFFTFHRFLPFFLSSFICTEHDLEGQGHEEGKGNLTQLVLQHDTSIRPTGFTYLRELSIIGASAIFLLLFIYTQGDKNSLRFFAPQHFFQL